MAHHHHTPGPWCLKARSAHFVIDSDRALVATIPFSDHQSAADGRLIASAPDLLAALRNLCNVMESNSAAVLECVDAARLAISKAEGRA